MKDGFNRGIVQSVGGEKVNWRGGFGARMHAHYYAGKLVDEMRLKIYSAEATNWLNWIESELDNIDATLTWSQTTQAGYELGTPLITLLTWFWYRRGYFHEGRRGQKGYWLLPRPVKTAWAGQWSCRVVLCSPCGRWTCPPPGPEPTNALSCGSIWRTTIYSVLP